MQNKQLSYCTVLWTTLCWHENYSSKKIRLTRMCVMSLLIYSAVVGGKSHSKECHRAQDTGICSKCPYLQVDHRWMTTISILIYCPMRQDRRLECRGLRGGKLSASAERPGRSECEVLDYSIWHFFLQESRIKNTAQHKWHKPRTYPAQTRVRWHILCKRWLDFFSLQHNSLFIL